LAPFGNIILTLFQAGVSTWYLPTQWIKVLSNLKTFDLLMLGSVFAAGVALFIQKKTSWFIAIAVLVLTMIHNSVTQAPPNASFVNTKLGLLLTNAVVLVIVYFFRYPYLDQRDHLFEGIRKRFNVHVLADYDGQQVAINNLSRNGCFVVKGVGQHFPDAGQDVQLKLRGGVTFSGVVRHKTDKGVGVSFHELTKKQKDKIKELFSKHREEMKVETQKAA
jgi:hypothetical protein